MSPPALDPKFEAPLMELANQSGGDLRQLLYAFFAFLNRRTDFYMVPNEQDIKDGVPVQMGFREGDAEKLLLAAFRQFPLRRMPPRNAASSTNSAKAQPTTTDATSQTRVTSSVSNQPAASPPNNNIQPDDKNDTNEAPAKKVPATKTDSVDEVRLTEEGKQVPVGNGGTTKDYTWTQTLDETSVLVAVPEGTKGKDLDVSIKPSSVSVRMKRGVNGQDCPPTLIEGDLVEKIRTDESTWSLEGGVLVLTLDKLKKTWWETVLVGDDKIDTTLVDSRRRIDEYDGSTQAAIRKIMFDQRQERLGLPTSDELEGKLPNGVEYIDNAKLEKYERESG